MMARCSKDYNTVPDILPNSSVFATIEVLKAFFVTLVYHSGGFEHSFLLPGAWFYCCLKPILVALETPGFLLEGYLYGP
jgi:hypothetical protein